MHFPSKLIDDAVTAFAQLPGIGKKTALRLTLHLLKESPEAVEQFGNSFIKMRNQIRFCDKCHNISDHSLCGICSNPVRDQSAICIVEGLRDLIAIENTHHYKGTYHILGGIISPIDGIGPETLNIESLIQRIEQDTVTEVIMALNPSIEGDTTIFYLSKRLKPYNIKVTTIARGVSFGGELEYTDELTLGRSIITRTPYENYLSPKAAVTANVQE